jgi:4-cresol dehydrogenase (hydroxylating)
MRGQDALDMLRTVEPIFNEHGFDMVVSLILLTERSLVAIFNIAFDKNAPGENEAASACYEKLVDVLMGMGHPLYRAGLQGMPKMREPDSVFWDVASEIKRTLDPGDIISRGRYIAPLDESK